MANNVIRRIWNQNKMVNIEALQGMAFQAEDGGHTFEISGVDDTGAAVALSGTVIGVFRRPDNADIALTGASSDGKVSVNLTEDCYAVPGRFGLTIFVTADSKKTAVYACVGTVAQTNGGAVAGSTPQDVVDLINAIAAAVATIPASYTDLMAAIAPTYSPSGLYPVGFYVWYDGDLYRCTTPITTAETWTAAHWKPDSVTNGMSIIRKSLSCTTVNLLELSFSELSRQSSVIKNLWDGKLQITGSSTTAGTIALCDLTLPAGTYKYGSLDTMPDSIQIRDMTGGSDQGQIGYTYTSDTFTLTQPTDIRVRFHVTANRVYDSIIAPMLTLESNWPTTFVPNITAVDYTARTDISKAFLFKTLSTSDLNDAEDEGYYILSSATVYDNSPLEDGAAFASAKHLFVFPNMVGGYKLQVLLINSGDYNGNCYKRLKSGNPATWKAWIKIVDASLESSVQPFVGNTKIGDYAFNSRNSQGYNDGTRLRVMSYNLRGYKTDSSVNPVYIPADKLGNLQKLLMHVNADIICTQEDSSWIEPEEAENRKGSAEYLYYPAYPVAAIISATNARHTIRSKKNFSSSGFAYLTDHDYSSDPTHPDIYTDSRDLRFAVYSIKEIVPSGSSVAVSEKELLVVCTHPIAHAENITARTAEYQNLYKWIKGQIDLPTTTEGVYRHVPTYTHCIIGMDANSVTVQDRANLLQIFGSDFKAANGGVLGWIPTHSTGPLDNILASNNVVINSTEVMSGWEGMLYSDHYPIWCDLTLLDQ